jgi:hypothetical protein
LDVVVSTALPVCRRSSVAEAEASHVVVRHSPPPPIQLGRNGRGIAWIVAAAPRSFAVRGCVMVRRWREVDFCRLRSARILANTTQMGKRIGVAYTQ